MIALSTFCNLNRQKQMMVITALNSEIEDFMTELEFMRRTYYYSLYYEDDKQGKKRKSEIKKCENELLEKIKLLRDYELIYEGEWLW